MRGWGAAPVPAIWTYRGRWPARSCCIVKRRHYAEYGAPLYLLVDRQERSCTLSSAPAQLGYTEVSDF